MPAGAVGDFAKPSRRLAVIRAAVNAWLDADDAACGRCGVVCPPRPRIGYFAISNLVGNGIIIGPEGGGRHAAILSGCVRVVGVRVLLYMRARAGAMTVMNLNQPSSTFCIT